MPIEEQLLCSMCGREYTTDAVCGRCNQMTQTEIDLAGALRQARIESGGLTLSRIAKIIHEVLKDDTQSLLKELMKYEI